MIARFSRPVSVRRLHKEEVVEIRASEAERAALAEALDLLALDRLEAVFTLRPWRGEGVHVTGTVSGEVTQACVVSLEPVPGTVLERFDLRFHPDVGESGTVEVDPDEPDPPEPLETDTVDLGAIAAEHFALGLAPYPRAPGVEFAAPDGDEADEPSPFAALAGLKDKLN